MNPEQSNDDTAGAPIFNIRDVLEKPEPEEVDRGKDEDEDEEDEDEDDESGEIGPLPSINRESVLYAPAYDPAQQEMWEEEQRRRREQGENEGEGENSRGVYKL